MTDVDLYHNLLIELNKAESPSHTPEAYNHLINKGTQQFFNKMYTAYNSNQQKTDDVESLVQRIELLVPDDSVSNTFRGVNFYLPENYWHLLNCIVTVEFLQPFRCYSVGEELTTGAKRATADIYSFTVDNVYMKPRWDRMYYYISNSILDDTTVIQIFPGSEALAGNFVTLRRVNIDYLKVPELISITQAKLDDPFNLAEELEFSDNVAYRIINEIAKIVLENASDQRTSTHVQVSQSVPGD